MQLFGYAITDIGLKRTNNEDAFLLLPLSAPTPETLPVSTDLAIEVSDQGTLLAVSDGIGGCNAGEVASALALTTLHSCLRTSPPAAQPNVILQEAVRATDHAVRAASTTTSEREGMGATLTALWLHPDGAWLGQVGDSRLYRLRDNQLHQLSPEHSPVGRMRLSGELTEDQARRHRYKHLIDQSLGAAPELFAPDVLPVDLAPGDIVLLCSDGLSDGLADADITAHLQTLATHETTPHETTLRLIEAAKTASGRDNITAIVALLA